MHHRPTIDHLDYGLGAIDQAVVLDVAMKKVTPMVLGPTKFVRKQYYQLLPPANLGLQSFFNWSGDCT